MDQLIGELKFRQGGRPMVAKLSGTLPADLHWSCDDKSFEELLNDSFGVGDLNDVSTDVHQPVVHSIYQAAERLGADVRIVTRRAGAADPSPQHALAC